MTWLLWLALGGAVAWALLGERPGEPTLTREERAGGPGGPDAMGLVGVPRTAQRTREIGARGLALIRAQLTPKIVAHTRYGLVEVANPEIALEREREFAAWRAPPRPTLPWDPSRAATLAPLVAANVSAYLGFYSPGLVAEFQEAAGLRAESGVPDGRYGGRTVGALLYFQVPYPPAPIHDPIEVLPYEEPA